MHVGIKCFERLKRTTITFSCSLYNLWQSYHLTSNASLMRYNSQGSHLVVIYATTVLRIWHMTKHGRMHFMNTITIIFLSIGPSELEHLFLGRVYYGWHQVKRLRGHSFLVMGPGAMLDCYSVGLRRDGIAILFRNNKQEIIRTWEQKSVRKTSRINHDINLGRL